MLLILLKIDYGDDGSKCGKVRWWTTTEHWCASAEAGDFWDHVPEMLDLWAMYGFMNLDLPQ